jgi:hypothetical protein
MQYSFKLQKEKILLMIQINFLRTAKILKAKMS